MMRYDLINKFIQQRGFTSYMELGLQKKSQNYDHIICAHKSSIDPNPSAEAEFVMTSDEYFASEAAREARYSIFFIDGWHNEFQVLKDAKNALNHLNPNGVIVFHDCLPYNEQVQLEEMQSGAWFGTTWRAWVKIRKSCPYLTYTVSSDCGMGIIDTSNPAEPLDWTLPSELNWQWYLANSDRVFGLVDDIQ